MSRLKLKQIAGPSNGKQGSVIVFDNSVPKWSTDLSTALQIPTGSTAQRPQTATPGMIRYNSDTQKVETYENGAWRNVVGGNPSFASLSDGPGALQAGKAVKVNDAGTGLEYTNFPTGLQKFRFKVILNGQNPVSIEELPQGWAVEITTTTLKVTHNLNTVPAFASTFGKYSLAASEYIHRITGAGAAGAISLRYDITNLNFCYIASLTANSTGAQTNTHVYVDLYFLLS